MGWYAANTLCPNCKRLARAMCRDSAQDLLYLVCSHCGLKLHSEKKVWPVKNSYIDPSVIGKDLTKEDLETLVDLEKNEEIVKEPLDIM
jgi:hypothetical protein